MTALVVYESMWGSTKAVAEAIGDGLAPVGPVRVVEVGAFEGAISDDVTCWWSAARPTPSA